MHRLRWPKQAKQIKEKKAFLLFEVAANPEEVPLSSQLQNTSPETRCPVPKVVPRAYVRTLFYMECDITLMVTLEHHGLNGGKASHWLREFQQWGVVFLSQLIHHN